MIIFKFNFMEAKYLDTTHSCNLSIALEIIGSRQASSSILRLLSQTWPITAVIALSPCSVTIVSCLKKMDEKLALIKAFACLCPSSGGYGGYCSR